MWYMARPSQDSQKSRLNDPEWHFLAEFSLREVVLDLDIENKPELSLLIRSMRDLGLNREVLTNIHRKLITIAEEAKTQSKQGGYETPVYLRLYCQKKTIQGLGVLSSSSQSDHKQAREFIQIIHQSDPKTNGGWGYFLVERIVDLPMSCRDRQRKWVDIYLYTEGE
jgi:hypothetical protein